MHLDFLLDFLTMAEVQEGFIAQDIAGFQGTMHIIIAKSMSDEFPNIAECHLVDDLIAFARYIFPRKSSMIQLREMIRKDLRHDTIEAFSIALGKYMLRIYPDFCDKYCNDEQSSARNSLFLQDIYFALKFLLMEYVTWDECNTVNEAGKEVLKATAKKFNEYTQTLKVMIGRITDGEDRYRMRVSTDAHRLALLNRLLDDEDGSLVKEVLMEDFYSKCAPKVIWEKIDAVRDVQEFYRNNPEGELCGHCLDVHFDEAHDFAFTDVCWDLYCIPCMHIVAHSVDGICTNFHCNGSISYFMTRTNFHKYREEVDNGVLSPYEVPPIEPEVP
ncbi:uncharacterized protein LOC108675967 [Hyalella azteca]|uniref:Uncharacterized protein LOC108675967 n=1 Tax=Hyalella azteca TaxID=294128 RepID=A0A8B7P0H3_HYAAZ|nr:uncharacterized protein LOC108675967 [Hyalella azteca]